MAAMILLSRRSAVLGLAIGGGTALVSACGSRAAAPAQDRARADLYDCEGCEASTERSAADLAPHLQLAAAAEPGERMILTGRALLLDGRTPAAGVVIYAHHTNAAGLYANGTPETEWSRRHGRLRGWVATDADGQYRFDTIKPAPYPSRDLPAHVHLYIADPGRRPYYIDDVVFAGEFGVTPAYRANMPLRGGDGVVTLARDANRTWRANRDIVLERHPG
jgi:protocatechuate 3,4-dioxygenase, beta subunit